MRHTAYVVDEQLGLPDYRRWNRFFICITRKETHTKVPEGMVEVLEKNYTYEDMFNQIKYN